MSVLLIKKLIEDDMLDLGKLVIAHYKKIGLSESEAIVLSELAKQMKRGESFLSASKIAKKVAMDKAKLLDILDGLIKKHYITIQVKKNQNGKETEIFHLDNTIEKIIARYEKSIRDDFLDANQAYASDEDEIVHLVETHMKKQLTPLEAQMIEKWFNEDGYDKATIKRALLDAAKGNNFTMSYVDSLLLAWEREEKKEEETVYRPEKSEALKAFFASFDDDDD
jgi:DNA replication protein